MKVTIEIDATPQEMRTMLGLPDFEPIQKEVMEKAREKVMEAIDSNDPSQLMKMFMPTNEHLQSMESLQSTVWEAMAKNMGFSMGKDQDEKK